MVTSLALVHGAGNHCALGIAIDAAERQSSTNDTAETFASNET